MKRAPDLYPKDFLNLADFPSDFTTGLFTLAFRFQIGIVGDSSNFFLNFALHFVKLAFGFVLRAFPHGLPPFVKLSLLGRLRTCIGAA